jgi:hypothetical protein
MGDRSWTEVICRKSDYESTLRAFLPESDEIEPGFIHAWNSEANNGLLEEREAWAEAGIPFHGEHAACLGAYEGAIFASDGKVHVDTFGVAGQPVARMNRDLEYDAVDDEEARRYWNVFSRAEQLIREGCPCTPETVPPG